MFCFAPHVSLRYITYGCSRAEQQFNAAIYRRFYCRSSSISQLATITQATMMPARRILPTLLTVRDYSPDIRSRFNDQAQKTPQAAGRNAMLKYYLRGRLTSDGRK